MKLIIKNKTYETMLNDITQEELKAKFDYDSDNGILIRKFRFNKPYNQHCGHKPNGRGYGTIVISGTAYLAHRLIWLFHYGEFPSEFIDHIDGNKMNNRIENLREADQTINNHNAKIRKDNTSGFPGVHLIKRTGKYQAEIQSTGKRKHLGNFNTPEEAFLSYQLAKIKYHPTSPDAKKYAEELGIIIHE